MLEDAPLSFRGVLHAAAGGDGAMRTSLAALGPGLPVADSSDRAVWGPEGAAYDAALAVVRDRAIAERDEPWPQPRASDAARVYGDGDRDTWEQAAFARQHRLTRSAVMAATTGDAEWTDAVVDGVLLLCEQSSWCWPAHDDVHGRHGSVLADPDHPFVDLGAGEVVAQLAWIDHLLGDSLDADYPGVRGRIRREAHLRIFRPFVTRRDWHWIGLDGDVHNWNPWIHGNILTAALALLDQPGDDTLRIGVLALCLEGIDRYATALPGDGAIDEGYAYWWNGACRALEALSLLCEVSQGEIDLIPRVPALRETVSFPHRTHLGGEWFVNHADGPARTTDDQPWQALFSASVIAGDEAARAFALAHRSLGDPVGHERHGCGRLLRALTDTAWVSATTACAPLPRESWHPSTQVLLARERAGSADGLTVAAKGGHNGEHHNHNDVGSFLVASDGVPVIVDAGRPTYTAQTFGADRYALWMMQSSWHNTPEPRAHAQAAGATHAARDVSCRVTDQDAALTLDLAGAYDLPELERWNRTVTLTRAGAGGSGRARMVRARAVPVWMPQGRPASPSTTRGRTDAATMTHPRACCCSRPAVSSSASSPLASVPSWKMLAR